MDFLVLFFFFSLLGSSVRRHETVSSILPIKQIVEITIFQTTSSLKTDDHQRRWIRSQLLLHLMMIIMTND